MSPSPTYSYQPTYAANPTTKLAVSRALHAQLMRCMCRTGYLSAHTHTLQGFGALPFASWGPIISEIRTRTSSNKNPKCMIPTQKKASPDTTLTRAQALVLLAVGCVVCSSISLLTRTGVSKRYVRYSKGGCRIIIINLSYLGSGWLWLTLLCLA